MALSENQIKQRDNKLTASRVKVLMDGETEEITQLWREMLGMALPKDLTWVWPVMRGSATEQINLDWYGHKTGHEITRRGEVVIGNPDWMAATLDGWDATDNHPIECKDTGGREPASVIVSRYQAQCHWQMMVTNSKICALSIIMGGAEPIREYIHYSEPYAKELMTRAAAFMLCVETLTPPAALPIAAPPLVPVKIYQMAENDQWVRHAQVWRQCQGAAQSAKDAEKSLKALVPEDAAKAVGAGIVITRNRAGAMSLRETS
jgi:hypothetical protein